MGRACSSLNDVAAHAGVSAMTVSRVVNRSGPVSAAMRAKVMRSLEALGVRKDRFASIAAGKRGPADGPRLVVVDATQEARNGSAEFAFYSRIAMTALARLAAIGCRTVLTNLARGIDGHLDALVEADAAIYCSPLPADTHRRIIAINRGMPCVSVCRPQEGASLIAPDDGGGGALAAEQVAAAGHREVVVLTAAGNPAYASRTRAFCDRLRALLPDAAVEVIAYPQLADGVGADDAAVQAAIAAGWDRRTAPPGLVFAVGGYGTLMLHRFLSRRRIAVPGQVSLLGFDAMPFFDILEPRIDRIEFPVEALGHLAVDEVLRRLGHDTDPGAIAAVVPCAYVAGESLRHLAVPCATDRA